MTLIDPQVDLCSPVINFDITHDGHNGEVIFRIGRWKGDTIFFEFEDKVYDAAGIITYSAFEREINIIAYKPYPASLRRRNKLHAYLNPILKKFILSYTYGWSPTAHELQNYDFSYHRNHGYLDGSSQEIAIKSTQAQIIQKLSNSKKLLIAGCSAGELVRQCRKIGLNAYGFDIIPNIDEIVFPEVKDFIRGGSLTNIPFDREDSFSTFIAIDVLEHIPERDIPQMVMEWIRLDFIQLILLTNLNDPRFKGHITLRSIDWWASQWAKFYKLIHVQSHFPGFPNCYSNSGDYNRQWTLWQKAT